MKWWILCALLSCPASGLLFAQQPAAKPAFEVASIKPSQPQAMGQIRIMMSADAGMLRYTNVSLRDCIRVAYRVKDFQIEGPDWLGSTRFDIVAKFPAGASQDQVPEMMQALLEERFKLTLHRDAKEHSVNALVVAKGGPKLTPAEVQVPDQPGAGPGPDKGGMGLDKGGPGPEKGGPSFDKAGSGPEKGGPPPRGGMMIQAGPGGVHLKAPSATLALLSEMISRFTERPVVDMTGIDGRYAFDLEFAPETMRGMRMGMPGPMPPPGGGEHAPPDAAVERAASVYEAVQRYGLKLEPKKAPLDVLTVDHIEKEPTEN